MGNSSASPNLHGVSPYRSGKGCRMRNYFVTFGGSADNKPAPAAIDIRPQGFELSEALAHACRLLSEKKEHVTIQDGTGKSISGDYLVACCRGDKLLSPDLRAVPAPKVR